MWSFSRLRREARGSPRRPVTSRAGLEAQRSADALPSGPAVGVDWQVQATLRQVLWGAVEQGEIDMRRASRYAWL